MIFAVAMRSAMFPPLRYCAEHHDFELDSMSRELPPLTYLGRSTPAPKTPDEAILDRAPNPYDKGPYVVRFSAPEFTVLCAVTGQPDFAHIMIDYVPKDWLVESKALKFFLASFRNHSGFHEETTITIGSRLADVLEPVYLRVGGLLVSAWRHTD